MAMSAVPAAAGTQIVHSYTAEAGAPSKVASAEERAFHPPSGDVKSKPDVKVIGTAAAATATRERSSQSETALLLHRLSVTELQGRIESLQIQTHTHRNSYVQANENANKTSVKETAQAALKQLVAARGELEERIKKELTEVYEAYLRSLHQCAAHLIQEVNKEFFPKFAKIVAYAKECHSSRAFADEQLLKLLGSRYKEFCLYCKRPQFLKYFEQHKRAASTQATNSSSSSSSSSKVKEAVQEKQEPAVTWAQSILLEIHLEEDKAACIAFAFELDIADYQKKLASSPRKMGFLIKAILQEKSAVLYKAFLETAIKRDSQFAAGIHKIFQQLMQPDCLLHVLPKLLHDLSTSANSKAAYENCKIAALEIVEAFLNQLQELFCRLNNKFLFALHEELYNAALFFLSQKQLATKIQIREAHFFMLALVVYQLLLPLLRHKQHEYIAQGKTAVAAPQTAFNDHCANIQVIIQQLENLANFLIGEQGGEETLKDFEKRPQMVCALQDLQAGLYGKEPLTMAVEQIKANMNPDVDQLDFIWWAVHADTLVKNGAKIRANFQSAEHVECFDALIIRCTLMARILRELKASLPEDMYRYFLSFSKQHSFEDKVVSAVLVNGFQVIEATVGYEKAKTMHVEYVERSALLYGKNIPILHRLLLHSKMMSLKDLITILRKSLTLITEGMGILPYEIFLVSLLVQELPNQVREDRIDSIFWKENFWIFWEKPSYLEQLENRFVTPTDREKYQETKALLPSPSKSSSAHVSSAAAKMADAKKDDVKTKK